MKSVVCILLCGIFLAVTGLAQPSFAQTGASTKQAAAKTTPPKTATTTVKPAAKLAAKPSPIATKPINNATKPVTQPAPQEKIIIPNYESKQFWQNTTAQEIELGIRNVSLSVTSLDKDDWTPLHWASAYCPDPTVAQLLIKHGAKLEARTKLGSTPLILALRNNGSPRVALALIKAGADTSARDADGKTAFTYLESNENLRAYRELDALSKKSLVSQQPRSLATQVKPEATSKKTQPAPAANTDEASKDAASTEDTSSTEPSEEIEDSDVTNQQGLTDLGKN